MSDPIELPTLTPEQRQAVWNVRIAANRAKGECTEYLLPYARLSGNSELIASAKALGALLDDLWGRCQELEAGS